MAEALGWGATDRPVPTVCAGGGPGGGPEPFPSGSRKSLTDARSRGTWKSRLAAGEMLVRSGRDRRDRGRHEQGNSPRADAPRPEFTDDAHGWSWSLRSNNQSHATVRTIDEPAGTLFFGHRANECLWVAQPHPDRSHPAEQEAGEAPDPIRITAVEAGILQSFPADYPWAGTKGQQFSQIGNAVPPLLAAHLLAPHIGAALNRDDFTLAA